MKVKATKREIKNQKLFVLGVRYCTIHHLLKRIGAEGAEVTLYNANVHGWRCDYYPINDDLGVVTGYNVDRACDVAQWDLNFEFNEKLRLLEDLAKDCKWDDTEERENLENDLIDLLDRARQGEFAKSYKGYIDGKLWAKGKTKGELKADFYSSRSELKALYKLDHMPKYNELTVEFY